MRPILTVRSTDIAGSYVAYTYADGHVETDPPNRPKFKEDLQRDRKIEVAKTRASAILAAEGSWNSAGFPSSVLRENTNIVTGSVLIRPYLEQLRKLADISETTTAAKGQIRSLLRMVPIGGKITGDNAGKQPEFVQDLLPQPMEAAPSQLPYYPNEV